MPSKKTLSILILKNYANASVNDHVKCIEDDQGEPKNIVKSLAKSDFWAFSFFV